jgi:hypothetical protein
MVSSRVASALTLGAAAISPLAVAFTSHGQMIQSKTVLLHAAPTSATSSDIMSSDSSRRSFLSTIATATTSAAFIPLQSANAAAPLTQDTARTQWNSSVTTINSLLKNWDNVGGGDAIRKELGTANFGSGISPLYQIEKAFKIIRDDDNVDLVEFTEQSEDFLACLARADTMAYSANFAGGSGKPTPPQVYIDKARKEVEALQTIAKSISALL